MSLLHSLGFVKQPSNKAAILFEQIWPDFRVVEYNSYHTYLISFWEQYSSRSNRENSTNGTIFELLVATLFYRENILPLYMQASISFVPNAEFDFFLYSKEFGPVCISLKTSLRERYKQADLEAMALKQVHRRAKCYLLTLSGTEAKATKSKIDDGSLIGLDQIVVANDPEFDLFIEYLKSLSFYIPEKIDVINHSQYLLQ